MAEQIEEWRNVEGFPNYAVSNFGRVKSLPRLVNHPAGNGFKIRREGKVLAYALNSYNYYVVSLVNGRVKVTRPVHLLVINAFKGSRPSSAHQCAHWDGNPKNNYVENLRWATPKENTSDAMRHGTRFRGEEHPRALLTEEDVLLIRELCANGANKTALGRQYGVDRTTIGLIHKRKNWAYLQ